LYFVALQDRMRREVNREFEQVEHYILEVTIEQKQPLVGYQGEAKFPFFKIVTALPKHVPTARSTFIHFGIPPNAFRVLIGSHFAEILEGGLYLPGMQEPVFWQNTFESNILFPLRFMIDCNIMGGSWIEVHPGKYKVASNPKSTCQIEINISPDSFTPHKPEGDWMKIAPIRVLSTDIECANDGSFPTADKDPVIQIANMVTIQGESRAFIHNVFVWGTCTPIVGADVRCFATEREMLLAWRDFIAESDPDMIIGYNILNFDFPYLWDRAKALKIPDFPIMSRIKGEAVAIKTSIFSSKAYGTKESHDISMFGRVFFDILQVMQREYKLRSYTLNSVSAEFLGEQKEDVHHSIITKLHNGTDDDRRRLAVYCLKDAYLPQRLMDKVMCFINYLEMARVTGVPFSYLLSRGQSIKVLSQLYRRANSEGLVVPTYKKGGDTGEEVGYEGAVVIPPSKAFYDVPITTLDFSSLYPSIMMAHNLCYSTMISPNTDLIKMGVSTDNITLTPSNSRFVKPSVRKGILPKILEDLISARNRAKKDMAVETDKFKKEIFNSRQLALKISANSVYGFTGATVGSLPCLDISASVTAYGRQMIETTRQVILEEYTVKNGYKWDAVVIYGDTDSVMVKFGTADLEEAMQLGREAAKFVTSKFIRPIQLEFEKVYFPYLLISKKRYAGLLWTKTTKWDKLDAKGIETVRRDNCLLVKHLVSISLKMILVERRVDDAIEFCKNIIRDLFQNKLDISLLVISKALSKNEYKGKQAHVELNARMKKRDAGAAYHIGDRIPYVIVKGTKGAAAYEKAEDPIYVLENNEPIDVQYYLEMLSRPLLRIFKPILGEKAASDLLTGEHTMSIAVPTAKKGGIVGFVKVQATCKGCRKSLATSDEILCDECKSPDKAPLIYMKQLDVVRQMQCEFGRLWTQCQSCQGSMHQEVLCTARDCPIFYLRTKVQKDLKDSKAVLDKFDTSW
jgi:DNA polymerase delta subunit 1